MASLLNQGLAAQPQVQGFPAKEEDVKALFKIAMDSVHNPKVRELLIKQLKHRPNAAPDIVAQLTAMLTWRIRAQVKEQMRVDLPEKNTIGLVMVIVTELYTLIKRLGGAPADKKLIQQTAEMSINQLDQMVEGQNGRR